MSNFKNSFCKKSPLKAKNEQGKEQGVDGKACWKDYYHAGVKDGKDVCKPIKQVSSPLQIKEEAYEKQNKKMRSDHKKDTGKTLGERQTSGKGSRRVSFACRFGGMAGDMTDDDGSPSKLAMALKKWGFSSKGEATAFCNKNKES